ncbi:MAG TPA: UDP-N-acetylmuramate dehydrogenase [Dissulfurispiraceae bacterium]|nr:UDP-N-acetylmuramate dehydrogenase [Dissulfurispiraceae bacterium]
MNCEPLIAWCRERGIAYRCDEPLRRHTYAAIGGPADVALFPESGQIPALLQMLRSSSIPYLVFGKGSNLLVSDRGVRGAVLFTHRVRGSELNAREGRVRFSAGVPLQQALRIAADAGLAGMEGLSGVPGTVGGAVAGNAGSFGVEMKDFVTSVTIVSADGSTREFPASELDFRYRTAVVPERGIITDVRLILRPDSPRTIYSRILEYRAQKMLSQPVAARSAGCAFKNPEGLSAGRLIDEAGCKGMRAGAIEVSRLHANFLINLGGGSADDYRVLMARVSARVYERSGVMLQPEIRMVGEWQF